MRKYTPNSRDQDPNRTGTPGHGIPDSTIFPGAYSTIPFIETGYEDQEGKCFVVGHEFEVTEDGSKKIVSSKSSGSPSGAEPLDKIVKKKE